MDPDAENFYAAPEAELSDPRDEGAEAIRRDHIQHEGSIKWVASLYMFSGACIVLYAGGTLTLTSLGVFDREETITALIFAPPFLLFGLGAIVVGRGMRRLRPAYKVPAAVLSILALFGLPCGTFVGAYSLHLLFSARGNTILSADYQDVIAATPDVRVSTPWYSWLALLAFLAMIGLVILAGMLA